MKFVSARLGPELRVRYGDKFKIITVDEGKEPLEFKEMVDSFSLTDNGDWYSPFPYIFKPPSPPNDFGLTAEIQAKQPIVEEKLQHEPYCKHCGAELPKGQSICHVCRKKVV